MKKIMKFFDVIYYNLYLFFKKTGEIEESAALFAMVFCFEFMISGILLSVCKILNVNIKYSILYVIFVLYLIIWFLLELRYLRKDKYMSIVRKKPIIKSKKGFENNNNCLYYTQFNSIVCIIANSLFL